uniref:Uncharacterized protein n=1 Tax=Steinernema glaseri TaxID=37863 RepID=A0A1I7Y7T7_9BILA
MDHEARYKESQRAKDGRNVWFQMLVYDITHAPKTVSFIFPEVRLLSITQATLGRCCWRTRLMTQKVCLTPFDLNRFVHFLRKYKWTVPHGNQQPTTGKYLQWPSSSFSAFSSSLFSALRQLSSATLLLCLLLVALLSVATAQFGYGMHGMYGGYGGMHYPHYHHPYGGGMYGGYRPYGMGMGYGGWGKK